MPELPDLEVFAANLDKQFKGKVLKEIDVTVTRKLNVEVPELKKKLEGHKLSSVSRNGKSLLLDFGKDRMLGLHLMLHGELQMKEEGKEPRFPIIGFDFTDGSGFFMTDFQKAATPTLNPVISEVPDAFTMSKEAFLELLAGKKTEIKSILLDQKFIRGIGNAYADEILWEARIYPFSPAKAIPAKNAEKLYEAMQRVLKNAIAEIRKANPDQLSGELRDFMNIHHSKKTESPTGARIQTRKVGGRTTYFTEEQERFGLS
ncbi:formamidopyrimidine-DNA glycosylase [Pedobacter yulinensis]|uniref:Formamidopyrimidine-DNA glycosylase n=1 Tax=Pedobacter yulinensis TaxID=2126353 RepID=A0A2T3HML7_9SPHI|nr:DNA-formamidopyrimidine glycosylase family protein [Pedobacter yulinensis]PST83611.1 formamidopyrimidine-DNA glycosylase [Pedobacter yulinensis]